jgi:hypothetical protein
MELKHDDPTSLVTVTATPVAAGHVFTIETYAGYTLADQSYADAVDFLTDGDLLTPGEVADLIDRAIGAAV